MNLPLVFIYKFCEKEIQPDPPGELREHRLGKVLQGKVKSIFHIRFPYFLSYFGIYIQVSC